MKESLVAINLLGKDDVLLNNVSGVPLLYYWDGKFDVIESLKKDKYFISLINSKCANIKNYTNSKISFFYFMYGDDNKEIYKENVTYVQTIFSLELLDNKDICNEYIIKHFNNLYELINNKPELNNEKELKDFILSKWSKEDNRNLFEKFLKEEKLNVNNVEYILKFYDENI